MSKKTSPLILRVPDPFDGSAQTRLTRMGVLNSDGQIDSDVMPVFAGIFSALFYDDLCDFYDDTNDLRTICQILREREGYRYSFLSIVKEDKPFESKKPRSETVTVKTDSNNLSVILAALAVTIPYDDGEYTGTLALDHTSLQTEVTGYSKKNYTISDTKTFGGLARNDPSLVPKTTVKNGVTLSLQSVEWSVQGTVLAGDALVPWPRRSIRRARRAR